MTSSVADRPEGIVISQTAAILSIIAALLLVAVGVLAIQRRGRTDVPAIGRGLTHRTRQAAVGIAIAIAIIVSALPVAMYPSDAARFQRLYGPLGRFIENGTQVLVVAVMIVGLIVLFRQRVGRIERR